MTTLQLPDLQDLEGLLHQDLQVLALEAGIDTPHHLLPVITKGRAAGGSGVARTGLTLGCEGARTDGREGGQWTDMAGREATPAAVAEAAVALAGAGVQDEEGDIPPLTPADHRQGNNDRNLSELLVMLQVP